MKRKGAGRVMKNTSDTVPKTEPPRDEKSASNVGDSQEDHAALQDCLRTGWRPRVRERHAEEAVSWHLILVLKAGHSNC